MFSDLNIIIDSAIWAMCARRRRVRRTTETANASIEHHKCCTFPATHTKHNEKSKHFIRISVWNQTISATYIGCHRVLTGTHSPK